MRLLIASVIFWASKLPLLDFSAFQPTLLTSSVNDSREERLRLPTLSEILASQVLAALTANFCFTSLVKLLKILPTFFFPLNSNFLLIFSAFWHILLMTQHSPSREKRHEMLLHATFSPELVLYPFTLTILQNLQMNFFFLIQFSYCF